MGNSRFDPGVYTNYSTQAATKTAAQIFTNTSGCHDDLNPTKFAVRESCDSATNPRSTPVLIGVDETGSMGHLAESIIKTGLGTIVLGIYDRKPISDPHVLLAAIGDASCDSSAIQTTQFEADAKALTDQIEKFYIEGNGGGNGGESYPILWYFALNKTKCDAIDKRGDKGYLFTIGDEAPLPVLTKEQIKRFFGMNAESDVPIKALLESVQESWEVFHLIVRTGATEVQDAIQKWRDLLGERAVVVEDHTKLPEVIVSLLQVNEGADAADVAASWAGDTAIVVGNAVSGLSKSSKSNSNAIEVI